MYSFAFPNCTCTIKWLYINSSSLDHIKVWAYAISYQTGCLRRSHTFASRLQHQQRLDYCELSLLRSYFLFVQGRPPLSQQHGSQGCRGKQHYCLQENIPNKNIVLTIVIIITNTWQWKFFRARAGAIMSTIKSQRYYSTTLQDMHGQSRHVKQASEEKYNCERWLAHFGSAIRHPMTPSKPRLWAAMAAQAIVLTLLGANGHSSLTGPAMWVSEWTRVLVVHTFEEGEGFDYYSFQLLLQRTDQLKCRWMLLHCNCQSLLEIEYLKEMQIWTHFECSLISHFLDVLPTPEGPCRYIETMLRLSCS